MPVYHGKPIDYGDLTPFAKNLRKRQTPEEAVLWKALKGNKLAGLGFRRQHVIEPYIVDFVCLKKRLIVELDGGQHQWPEIKEADEKRDKYLTSLGLRVLRFPNRSINADLPKVLSTILAAASPTP